MKLTTVLLVVGLAGLSVIYGVQTQEISPSQTDLYAKVVRAKGVLEVATKNLLGKPVVVDLEKKDIQMKCAMMRVLYMNYTRVRLRPKVTINSGSLKTNFASFSGNPKVTKKSEQMTVTGLCIKMVVEVNVSGQIDGWKDRKGVEHPRQNILITPSLSVKTLTVYKKQFRQVVSFSVDIGITEKKGKVHVKALPTDGGVTEESWNNSLPATGSVTLASFCVFPKSSLCKFDIAVARAQNTSVDYAAEYLQNAIDALGEVETTTAHVFPFESWY